MDKSASGQVRRPDMRITIVGSGDAFGSGGRVTFLLIALVLVQVLVPTADKLWLSGSLAVSYGIPFLLRLRQLIPRKN